MISYSQIYHDYQEPPNVIIAEPLNDKIIFHYQQTTKQTHDTPDTPESTQTKFYGECSFFPAYIPPNVDMIVQTPCNVFMKSSEGLYVSGILDYKTKAFESTPIIVKGMPSGLTQITGNNRRMIALIDGKVYKSSHLETNVMLKRIGKLQGIKQISCSENHYAALTSIGEVYLWGTNLNGEIGKKREERLEDVPLRVKEFNGKKMLKVICRNGYTAGMSRDGDVVTLGKIEWKQSDRVVDIVGYNERLFGLRSDGKVICNDGSVVEGDFVVDRIIEGLETIVGESNGKLIVMRENKWQEVDTIGNRDWSGRDNSLIILGSSTKKGFEGIFNEFKIFIRQMEKINKSYCDTLLPKLRELKAANMLKETKKKGMKRGGRSQSVFAPNKSEENTEHLGRLEEPLNYLYLLFAKLQKVYSFLLTVYGDNNSFNVAEFYQRFFDELEVLFIDYSDVFSVYLEVMNICKLLSPSFYNELEEIEKKFTAEDQQLFNKHCDFLSIVIIPFKFLSKLYLLTQQYRKINKEFPRSYFDRFEMLLFRCNEMLQFEDILSISHVFSTNGEYVVYLSTMKELVTQLTHQNVREPNYKDIFLLMYRLYTTPEQVMNYLIPHISIDETYEQKRLLLGILRDWMYKYPKDFVSLGTAENKFIDYLSTPKEQFKRIKSDKTNILELFGHIKQNEANKRKKIQIISFENVSLELAEFMCDPQHVANSISYVHKKLFTKIEPVELLNYLDKDLKDSSFNIKNMVESFNGLSKMYLELFNKTPSDKKLPLLKQTLAILDVLLKTHKNYHAICGIVFCFIRIPEIESLKNQLTEDEKTQLAYYDTLCNFESNYKNLREKISASKAPLLPFFGIISKDLTLASEYNASKEDGLYNFNKLRIMYNVIMDIINYQPNDVELPDNINDHFHKKFLQIHGLSY